MRLLPFILLLATLKYTLTANAEEEVEKLAIVISSEALCNLEYNKISVERRVSKIFNPDYFRHPENIALFHQLAIPSPKEMNEDEKTKYCNFIRQAAKRLGLIE
ncbi:hypothetical protein [Pseudovibrio sp. Ad26]|uniref:hypothetical protein n=1 Tax=Pseudovibrio sp. Ad26 TaxID=989410 RepID=UPI0007AE5E4A|nr:hypothetical protein [Pseudovibrio sp. Ad26]KZL07206.1 hypothetical protein PsAD26_03462 [Pseudovibrio sp. Ad26]